MMVESQLQCPHCGEPLAVMIDTSQGAHELTEDCTVCCRPIRLSVHCEPGEIFEVQAAPE